MRIGWLIIISLLYLSLVVAVVLGINEHDRVKKILEATLRRWVKLVAALVAIGAVIQVLSHL